MLVLSRKKNDSIIVNNNITIVVVEIRGDKARLGVDAPREVPVHRKEVHDAILRETGEDPAPLSRPELAFSKKQAAMILAMCAKHAHDPAFDFEDMSEVVAQLQDYSGHVAMGR